MATDYGFTSPTVPRLLQSRAIGANSFHQTLTLSPPTAPSDRPLPFPRPICPMSPSTSSPSIYSHPPSQTGHGSRTAHVNSRLQALTDSSDEEEDREDARLSMVSGPTVRKYAENPWEQDWHDDQDILGLDGRATRMMRSATQMKTRTVSPSSSTSTAADSTGSTRRGLSNILGVGKHLLPSASGVSLASTQTSSTASSDDQPNPITPKLKSAFSPPTSIHDTEAMSFATFTKTSMPLSDELKLGTPRILYNDRPLLSSGSPGSGLISLEVAQERERTRALSRTQGNSRAHRPAEPARSQHTAEPVRTPSTVSNLHRRTRPTPSIPIEIQEHMPTRRPGRSVSSGHSSPPATNRVKGKKSGLMKLFNKASSSPPRPIPIPNVALPPSLPSPRPQVTRGNSYGSHHSRPGNMWNENTDPTWPKAALVAVKPQLELRPVSMTFTGGLPSDYLSVKGETDPITANGEILNETAMVDLMEAELSEAVREQLTNAHKAWQIQLYELEAQIRELKQKLDSREQNHTGHPACEACGCTCGGGRRRAGNEEGSGGVMDRARVKTAGARGVSAREVCMNGNDPMHRCGGAPR